MDYITAAFNGSFHLTYYGEKYTVNFLLKIYVCFSCLTQDNLQAPTLVLEKLTLGSGWDTSLIADFTTFLCFLQFWFFFKFFILWVLQHVFSLILPPPICSAYFISWKKSDFSPHKPLWKAQILGSEHLQQKIQNSSLRTFGGTLSPSPFGSLCCKILSPSPCGSL